MGVACEVFRGLGNHPNLLCNKWFASGQIEIEREKRDIVNNKINARKNSSKVVKKKVVARYQ